MSEHSALWDYSILLRLFVCLMALFLVHSCTRYCKCPGLVWCSWSALSWQCLGLSALPDISDAFAAVGLVLMQRAMVACTWHLDVVQSSEPQCIKNAIWVKGSSWGKIDSGAIFPLPFFSLLCILLLVIRDQELAFLILNFVYRACFRQLRQLRVASSSFSPDATLALGHTFICGTRILQPEIGVWLLTNRFW